jgi:membrane protease subunit HflK
MHDDPSQNSNPQLPTGLGDGEAALQDALRVSFRLLRIVMVILIVVYIFSGIRIVPQDEKAVVLIFGKIRGIGEERVKGPGFFWTWPKPIAEIIPVNTEHVRVLDTKNSFWYFVDPLTPPDMEGNFPSGPTLDPARDGYTITGDVNLLHTHWALRYTVQNAEAYALAFQNVDDLLRNELRHAVVRVSAGFSIDRALRTDIASFIRAVENACRHGSDALNLGISIQGIELVGKSAPLQMTDAFDQVTIAENERAAAYSEATRDATQMLNKAEAKASEVVEEAHSAANTYISDLEARADYFRDIRGSLDGGPDSFKEKLLLQEARTRIFQKVQESFHVPRPVDGKETEYRIILTPRQKSPLKSRDN